MKEIEAWQIKTSESIVLSDGHKKSFMQAEVGVRFFFFQFILGTLKNHMETKEPLENSDGIM